MVIVHINNNYYMLQFVISVASMYNIIIIICYLWAIALGLSLGGGMRCSSAVLWGLLWPARGWGGCHLCLSTTSNNQSFVTGCLILWHTPTTQGIAWCVSFKSPHTSPHNYIHTLTWCSRVRIRMTLVCSNSHKVPSSCFIPVTLNNMTIVKPGLFVSLHPVWNNKDNIY